MSIFEGDAYFHAERIANLLAPLRGNDDAAKAASFRPLIREDYKELWRILKLIDQGDSPAIARIRFIVKQTRSVLSFGSMVQVLADSDLGDVARSGWRESLPSTSCDDSSSDDAGKGVARAVEDEVASKKKSKTHLQWLADAMLLVQDHPDWSDSKIAQKVGRDKSTLSRDRTYKAAAAMARGEKTDRHRGHITIDPDTKLQGIEAYPDDPAERDRDGQTT